MTEEQIKHMRDRFLGWRLPEEFRPDNGISYTSPYGCWSSPPIGTNLFDAAQADAMVRYMVEGMPAGPVPAALHLRRALMSKPLVVGYGEPPLWGLKEEEDD